MQKGIQYKSGEKEAPQQQAIDFLFCYKTKNNVGLIYDKSQCQWYVLNVGKGCLLYIIFNTFGIFF